MSSFLKDNRKGQAMLSNTSEAWPAARQPTDSSLAQRGACPSPSSAASGGHSDQNPGKICSEQPSFQLTPCWLQLASVPNLSDTTPVQADEVGCSERAVHHKENNFLKRCSSLWIFPESWFLFSSHPHTH